MNKLQKAGCIGALVAGILTAEPAYAQQPNSYDLKQETATQKDKMDAEREKFKLWAYLSIAGMAILLGTAFLYSKQQDEYS